MDAGQIGMTLLTAWIAKEWLRDLLALARTGADRERVGHLRWKFLTWCEDSEVRQLVVTLDRWWPEIAAFIATGHSNATSDGVNQMIKLCARNAHSFRKPGQPAATHTLRHHPPSPRTLSHRSTSLIRESRAVCGQGGLGLRAHWICVRAACPLERWRFVP